jgi:hypothetical protein
MSWRAPGGSQAAHEVTDRDIARVIMHHRVRRAL